MDIVSCNFPLNVIPYQKPLWIITNENIIRAIYNNKTRECFHTHLGCSYRYPWYRPGDRLRTLVSEAWTGHWRCSLRPSGQYAGSECTHRHRMESWTGCWPSTGDSVGSAGVMIPVDSSLSWAAGRGCSRRRCASTGSVCARVRLGRRRYRPNRWSGTGRSCTHHVIPLQAYCRSGTSHWGPGDCYPAARCSPDCSRPRSWYSGRVTSCGVDPVGVGCYLRAPWPLTPGVEWWMSNVKRHTVL